MFIINIEKKIRIANKDALIIVDIQNDFVPGGALPVSKGDEIVGDVNKVAQIFKSNKAIIVLTQDWHPKDHLSFASNHPGKKPGDEFRSDAIGPVLWPDHCVQGTQGANFHKDLNTNLANAVIRKGLNPKVDSYSGFLENDKKTETGLVGYLKSLKIERLFVCGLALDYCCYATAMDGIQIGFKVYFLEDLTRGIDIPPGNVSNCLKNMEKKGIKVTNKNSFI